MLGVVAMGFHPIPYYIIAFVLLIVFGYLWPILPISGGAAMNVPQGFNLELHRQRSAPLDPAGAVAHPGRHRRLVHRACARWSRTSSPRTTSIYAELGGVDRSRILPSYVMRNALVPQVTGLAMSLGAIFNGAIIIEQVFGYPGLGRLLIDAVYAGDYSLVLGVTTISIIAVSVAVFLIDILYPLIDPRVQLA